MPLRPTDVSQSLSEDLIQLRADVAAFHKEMRHRPPSSPYKVWLSFGLGAGTALALYFIVSLIKHLG
ncbi:hypothetical protein CCU68_31615 [Pseudomonas gingeri NCPPB 3146 = LMG 5327]|uniref:DUF3094 domain-containing protein n=1 Tax=Pseudomonas gingeri NCPPB 3146 = LMG 5327 TaxID=707248 RepID=A0ABX4XU77_9PSED|nr:hypothetical protein CCU68_31615 [Pseudomonas gingeri NCPPB 3146 = LMG 5327]BBP77539.1 hypothetical protein PHLH7_36430 [Pseudomonas sp. Ost2]